MIQHSIVSSLSSREELRKLMRQRRQKIPSEKQLTFAKNAALKMLTWIPIVRANNIAVFLNFDGEINTQPLIELLWKNGKNVYLPVLHPFICKNLLFLRYDKDSELVSNRLNIKEPKLNKNHVLSLSNLDVLIIPLVAFDKSGKRLGMGGGFYDRLLSNWQKYSFKLTGYAYDCQLIDFIPMKKWDIPLPSVVTPTKFWNWPKNNNYYFK